MFETIRIETDPRGVAHLWLAREDKHNALSAQMIRELTQAAAQLGADPAVRVVVLAAMGKSFVLVAIWAGCRSRCALTLPPAAPGRGNWR